MTSMRDKIGGIVLLGLMRRDSYDTIADAILEALMEPTEGMLDSIPASYSQSFQAIWPKICGDVFTAMILAAKEGK